MLPTAVSNGEVILIVTLVVAPIAALAFAGAGAVYREIGKGTFAMDRDESTGSADLSTAAARAEQQAELRQMLEAKAYRQRQRGEEPIDIDAELARLNAPSAPVRADPGLVDEVRQLVIARNARRVRRGEEPLDVGAEVERQLSDLEGL
jgi:hypothetical protein